jgi:hypothetical protein
MQTGSEIHLASYPMENRISFMEAEWLKRADYQSILASKKVKQSHYRPEQGQRVPGSYDSQIS